jgi:hypothetical protein
VGGGGGGWGEGKATEVVRHVHTGKGQEWRSWSIVGVLWPVLMGREEDQENVVRNM